MVNVKKIVMPALLLIGFMPSGSCYADTMNKDADIYKKMMSICTAWEKLGMVSAVICCGAELANLWSYNANVARVALYAEITAIVAILPFVSLLMSFGAGKGTSRFREIASLPFILMVYKPAEMLQKIEDKWNEKKQNKTCFA